MPLSFFAFLDQLTGDPALALIVLLTLAVLLVNGWTRRTQCHRRGSGDWSTPLPFGCPAGGCMQLSGSALCHRCLYFCGGDRLFYRQLWRRLPRGSYRFVCRHGRHRALGRGCLATWHSYQ